MRAIFCGMGGNAWLVRDVLADAARRAGYELVVISEWDDADIRWGATTWKKDMLSGDVVLCPQREDVQYCKSNVKVTTAMALGMPVIASNIPAYTEIIRHGENGYICSINDPDSWYRALVELRDAETRKRIGTAGRNSIAPYTLDSIAQDWERLFADTLAGKFGKPAPKAAPLASHDTVDLIIASYNALEYLKLTLASIRLNTDSKYHIIISDAGSGPETWEYLRTLQGITVLGEPGKRLNFSEACNAGIQAGNSKYFVIMNSDLIVSKGWLNPILDKLSSVDRLAACGVLSNCDSGWLWNAPGKPDMNMAATYDDPEGTVKTIAPLHPGMKMNEVKPFLKDVYRFMEHSNQSHKSEFVKQDWVAAYCTAFARSAIEDVGLFDPGYQNGCEDLDLCRRLRKSGYEIGQAIGSFVFHFGGISRGAYQEENREQYSKEDAFNHQFFRAKWAKKKIAIYTGPAWERWDRNTVDAGMAGSETWAAELSAEFSRRGYQVFLFGDCKEPHQDRDGVWYYPHQAMEEVLACDWVDAFICSRTCEPLKLKLHASQYFVMIHDIWLNQDKAYDVRQWQVKKYAVLSEWHKEFVKKHHSIPDSKLWMTANGVNQELYRGNVQKKNQAVYSSSPDRGLYQLLSILPEIRKAVPDFVLKVCYGWNNIDAAIRNGNQQLANLKVEILKLMDQPGVEFLGRVDKQTLARHQMESNVHLAPNWFSETFGITWVENGLARNALLSTDYAGLKSTVGDAGILLPWDGGYTTEYMSRFTKEAIRLLTDDKWRELWANRAFDKMQSYSWQSIADEWERGFGWK